MCRASKPKPETENQSLEAQVMCAQLQNRTQEAQNHMCRPSKSNLVPET